MVRFIIVIISFSSLLPSVISLKACNEGWLQIAPHPFECVLLHASPVRSQDTSNSSNGTEQVSLRGRSYHSTANMILGVVDGKQAVALSMGFGGYLYQTDDVGVTVNIHGDVYRIIDSLWTPSITASLNFDYAILRIGRGTVARWMTTASYGKVDLPTTTLLQGVTGTKISIPLGSDAYYNKTGLNAILVAGIGYDVRQKYGRELLNIGVEFSDWFCLTFDVSSLWKPMSPVINLGRLQ